MATKEFDPENPAHAAIADLIQTEGKAGNLSDAQREALSKEVNGGQRLGVIAKILGK